MERIRPRLAAFGLAHEHPGREVHSWPSLRYVVLHVRQQPLDGEVELGDEAEQQAAGLQGRETKEADGLAQPSIGLRGQVIQARQEFQVLDVGRRFSAGPLEDAFDFGIGDMEAAVVVFAHRDTGSTHARNLDAQEVDDEFVRGMASVHGSQSSAFRHAMPLPRTVILAKAGIQPWASYPRP